MSTHRDELIALQAKARRAGRICTFFFDENGRLDAVFYMDPKGGERARAGYITSLLSFAETEREKPGGHLPPAPPKKKVVVYVPI